MKDTLKTAVTAFFTTIKEKAAGRPLILLGLSAIESFLLKEIDTLFA